MATTITGLKEVQAKLTAAPSIIVGRLFAEALDRAIGVVAAEVESRCPTGEYEELADNVITRIKLDLVKVGGSAACSFSSNQSEKGAPMDAIALWVEYGHHMVTHDGKQVGEVVAHPFMRPAFAAAAARALDVFTQTLRDGFDKMGDL